MIHMSRYLREDGTIRSQYVYVNGLANGQATYYAEDGSVERAATFRDGVEVKP
jgi:antitoxin component YwqK of YwqJK toxin-antitoxin module